MSRTHTPLNEELSAYLRSVTVREPEPLRILREESASHPRASMQTAPEQGQFLSLLAKMIGAKKTLEVGVFMGYSSTWVASAIGPNGRIVACDISEEYTARARETWRMAGVEDRIDLRLGPALETLDGLIAQGQAGTFDFAFIDADKQNYRNYFDRAMVLVRTGGVIAVDNVLWDGDVVNPTATDADTEAIRAFNKKLFEDMRIALSIVPLGDGLTVACKL
jgi:predicted O-methyltransferase YrrM